jgi:serine/threonine protein phosphatase PrpC
MRWEIHGASRARAGETANGDAYRIVEREAGTVVVVADGLGHGPAAREAAILLCALVEASPFDASPASLFDAASRQLRATRGAAGAILKLRGASAEFTGLGNIAIASHPRTRALAASVPGIVGRPGRTPRVFAFELEPGDLIALYTDGIRRHFELGPFASSISLKDAADDLLGLHGKDADDATCVLARLTN